MMNRKEYKIGSLVYIKSGRYINPNNYKGEINNLRWVVDVPNPTPALITEELTPGINEKSYIALVNGKKIILHSDSIWSK
jgi:hypothetical protein